MVHIAGIGTVFCGGRGIDALADVLRTGRRAPVFVACPGIQGKVPVQAVEQGLLKDSAILQGMRRADRLNKMGVLAAADAWRDTGLADSIAPERIGVLVATGLGPHPRTFAFLDGILDYGDASASPTDFSHSVHNATAGYIAGRLQIHGPVETLTDFDFAFQQALMLAECWLAEERCDAVMLCAAEELGEVMVQVCSRLLRLPPDGIPKPYAFAEDPCLVPGEGAVCFALTRDSAGADYAGIETGAGRDNTEGAAVGPQADLTVFDAGGLAGTEAGYLSRLQGVARLANYTPLFGSMMTGTAFQCAAAALALKNGVLYATPLADTAPDLPLCRETAPAPLRLVECVKGSGRTGDWHTVRLTAVAHSLETRRGLEKPAGLRPEESKMWRGNAGPAGRDHGPRGPGAVYL